MHRRVRHAKRMYGEDGDFTAWGRPFDPSASKYENLEQYADAIVEVPAGKKYAVAHRTKILLPKSMCP
jgi:hypothetical protein